MTGRDAAPFEIVNVDEQTVPVRLAGGEVVELEPGGRIVTLVAILPPTVQVVRREGLRIEIAQDRSLRSC